MDRVATSAFQARLRLFVRIVAVQTRDDLDHAFAAFRSARPDAVLVSGDTFPTNAPRVAELQLTHQLPIFSAARPSTEAGSLASYGADGTIVARRAASYVQRILKGAKPGDLPVEQPTKFKLVITSRLPGRWG